MAQKNDRYVFKMITLLVCLFIFGATRVHSQSLFEIQKSNDRVTDIEGNVGDGGNMGDLRRGTFSSGTGKVSVMFNVTVPEYTPVTDSVYIVGSFNDWVPGELTMNKVADYAWQLIMELAENTTFEYKYTRGNWDTVEKDPNGAEIDNREIIIDSTAIIINDEVASWRDIEIPTDPENIDPILSYYNNSPQTAIAVTWASASQGENIIYYGINDISENQIIVDQYEDLAEVGDSLIHIARLSNLLPNTTYQYKVETAGIFASDTFNFTTAAEETDFMFIVGGDNQPSLVKPVLDSILAENPRFMINVGDLVVDGNNLNYWYKFLGNFREMLGNYVMMPIYGNHEEDSPTLTKLFQFPSNGSPDSTNEGHWFSFDYNNVHIIGLDVYREFAPGSEQYNWLKNDLQSIDENIDHRIVYVHEPAYSSTATHEPNLHIRQYLEPLFIEYDVDIVFSGHNHHYERSMANNIVYIITGGLGTSLRDFDQDSNPWSIYGEKLNHYCRVSVNGEDIKVEMVRQDGTIGDVYESFKIDGYDGDWLSLGIEPLVDTDDLQTDPDLKLNRFYITEDADYFYFGFDAPAKDKGISYGLYIDVDNITGSGGTTDCWGKAVTAEPAHLPEIEIYAYHKNDDSWSSSSPKYYSWDANSSDWISASGGMGSLPEGGFFAVDTISRFFEMVFPKDAPGFNGSDSFFVELFTVGETSGAGASESIPSDSSIQFTVENTSTDITVLSAFHGYNITTPPPVDPNPIHIDGNPNDWIDLGLEPLATDTDNAQHGTEYRMDSLYVHMDSVNIYFGFMTPAEKIGLHYGIYIDTDNASSSGGTIDKWRCDVTAVDEHRPDVTIYAYHGDTGAWSGSSPKYYTWNGSDWAEHTGGQGSLPPGGRFAHDANLDFVEILIPQISPGFKNVTDFHISLFNFGAAKYVCETVPSDPAVNFNGENTATTVQLSSFAYYQMNPVAVEETGSLILPGEFLLYQNYPNPFNPTTQIRYSLSDETRVSLVIYDILGREIITLINEKQAAGYKRIIWDGRDTAGKMVSAGCYLYQLNTDKGFSKVMKMLFLK